MADVRDAILRVRRDHRAALSVSVQAGLKATPASRYGGRHWFGGALVRTAGRQAKYEDLVGREDRGRAHVVEQDGELCLDTQPLAADDVPDTWRWGREFLGQHGRGQSVTVEDRRDAQCARGGRWKASRKDDRRPLAEARGGPAKRESGEQAVDNTDSDSVTRSIPEEELIDLADIHCPTIIPPPCRTVQRSEQKFPGFFVAAECQPSLCLLTADAFHPSVLVSGRPHGA